MIYRTSWGFTDSLMFMTKTRPNIVEEEKNSHLDKHMKHIEVLVKEGLIIKKGPEFLSNDIEDADLPAFMWRTELEEVTSA